MASLIVVHPDGTKGSSLGISYSPHLLKNALSEGDILSFQSADDLCGTRGVNGIFTMGSAMVILSAYLMCEEGDWHYSVRIESPNVHDFNAALREVYRRIGKPFEDLTPACMVRHPSEQSCLKGIGNDFRNLRNFISRKWYEFRKKIAMHFMR